MTEIINWFLESEQHEVYGNEGYIISRDTGGWANTDSEGVRRTINEVPEDPLVQHIWEIYVVSEGDTFDDLSPDYDAQTVLNFREEFDEVIEEPFQMSVEDNQVSMSEDDAFAIRNVQRMTLDEFEDGFEDVFEVWYISSPQQDLRDAINEDFPFSYNVEIIIEDSGPQDERFMEAGWDWGNSTVEGHFQDMEFEVVTEVERDVAAFAQTINSDTFNLGRIWGYVNDGGEAVEDATVWVARKSSTPTIESVLSTDEQGFYNIDVEIESQEYFATVEKIENGSEKTDFAIPFIHDT